MAKRAGFDHNELESTEARDHDVSIASAEHGKSESTSTLTLSRSALDSGKLNGRGNAGMRAAVMQRQQATLGMSRSVQRFIQRASATAAPEVKDDSLATRIQAKAGSGSALDNGVRDKLESGLGADLSGVRVHTDSEAHDLNQQVDAVAFTTGSDIFFRSGAYNPGTDEGMKLLAHEATHTVQQAQGPVAGTPAPGGVAISDPSDSYEQAAEATAERVASGASAHSADAGSAHEGGHASHAASGAVQRQEAPIEEEEQKKRPEEEEAPVQTMRASVQRSAATSFGVDLESPGAGQELPSPVRTKMESTLGADLSDVRVHTDGQAERMGAHAFASGNNVHFAEGNYDPGSQPGQEMLGHELAHVVQQREGRVQAPDTASGNTTVFQDPTLETEADTLGSQAASGVGAHSGGDGTAAVQTARNGATPGAVVQQKPVAQGIIPAGIAAMGAALAGASAADAAAVSGLILTGATTAVQAGAAVQPGSTGVQTLQLPDGWMSEMDKEKLQLIVQYRYINAFVRNWIAAHPGESVATPAPEPASTTTTTPATPTTPAAPAGKGGRGATPAPTPPVPTTAETTTPGGPNAAGSEVDAALREAVKTEVRLQIQGELNSNTKTAPNKSVLWTDDDAHDEPDWVGTTGEVEFVNVKGTHLHEGLNLSPEALQIPNLILPMRGQEMNVVQYRGGRLRQGNRFETGMNDDLGVNLVGGAAQMDQSGNNGHGKHTYDLEWKWDDNATHSEHDLTIDFSSGMPHWEEDRFQGEAES